MLSSRWNRICVTAVLAVALVVSSFAIGSAGPNGEAAAASKASKTISWSKAKSIFLDEFPELKSVKYLHLTTDDGQKVYEGKAVKGSYVYSIEINAKTGKVQDSDVDYEGSRYSASKVGAVSKSKIKSKILEKVPGATIIYIKLDKDDGRYVYEAEAYKKGYEYDFEFTKSGRLIEYEKDKV